MKPIRVFLILISLLPGLTASIAQTERNTCKPWTYWWWMGSAVNQKDIQKQLTEFSKSGLGGVHIIPIYGVKGFESQFLPFLSEQWMEQVQFTIRTAADLGLGVDMTAGTGWPYGGPWVDQAGAAKRFVIKEDSLHHLSLSISNTNQKVKRAAPGGEGLVIDYFDQKQVMGYLQYFDSVFANTQFPFNPRAWYHDSYEAYGANWSERFPERFKEIAGYELAEVLPVLMDTLSPKRPLVVHDFRKTLADLLYTEFATTWTTWCKTRGTGSRYQAHGSPGNLLDLYALADIPETESFGCGNFPIPNLHGDPDYEESRFGRPSPLMMKFAFPR